MDQQFLILGATGSLGYALTKELISKGNSPNILCRSRKKAEKLFENPEHLLIHEGDALDQQLLTQISMGKQFIFHGINYPYPNWDPSMFQVTDNVILAARESGATILFPGNVYNYGNTSRPITEQSARDLNTKKGRIRQDLEDKLRQASKEHGITVIILRLPDFWGPNVTNGLIKPIFSNALKGKAMRWPLRTDIPHQMVYTPDAAKALLLLSNQLEPSSFNILNYGGQTFPSIFEFTNNVAYEAQKPFKLKPYKKWMLNFGALFDAELRELKEMLYLFENSIVLDDTKFRTRFPNFSETDIQEAIRTTLDWFREWERD